MWSQAPQFLPAAPEEALMIGLVVSFGSEDKGGCQQSQNPVMECLLMIWLTWCQCLIGVSLIREAEFVTSFNWASSNYLITCQWACCPWLWWEGCTQKLVGSKLFLHPIFPGKRWPPAYQATAQECWHCSLEPLPIQLQSFRPRSSSGGWEGVAERRAWHWGLGQARRNMEEGMRRP